jgi:DNA-binding transcriptional LysR family regulator
MLDVGRLRVFREVAIRRSFSAAADALDYTQSAVSQQISKLERDVGLTLIDRGRRPIGLTEAGDVLLARTDLIFGEVAAAEADLGALAGLEAGTLRIGGFATACATILPHAIRLFTERHPGVAVQLSEMEPGLARRRLRAAEIDLAVTYRFGEGATDEVTLAEDPFVLALPQSHRLAGRPELRLAELREDQWLGASGTGASEGYRGFVVGLCREAGFEPRVAFEPGDLWTGCGIIAAGLAVGVMPRLAFSIPFPGIEISRIAGAAPARTITAVQVPGRRSPAAAPMIECLRRAAGARPATPRGSGE